MIKIFSFLFELLYYYDSDDFMEDNSFDFSSLKSKNTKNCNNIIVKNNSLQKSFCLTFFYKKVLNVIFPGIIVTLSITSLTVSPAFAQGTSLSSRLKTKFSNAKTKLYQFGKCHPKKIITSVGVSAIFATGYYYPSTRNIVINYWERIKKSEPGQQIVPVQQPISPLSNSPSTPILLEDEYTGILVSAEKLLGKEGFEKLVIAMTAAGLLVGATGYNYDAFYKAVEIISQVITRPDLAIVPQPQSFGRQVLIQLATEATRQFAKAGIREGIELTKRGLGIEKTTEQVVGARAESARLRAESQQILEDAKQELQIRNRAKQEAARVESQQILEETKQELRILNKAEQEDAIKKIARLTRESEQIIQEFNKEMEREEMLEENERLTAKKRLKEEKLIQEAAQKIKEAKQIEKQLERQFQMSERREELELEKIKQKDAQIKQEERKLLEERKELLKKLQEQIDSSNQEEQKEDEETKKQFGPF